MIEDFDLEQLARPDQVTCNFDVSLGWCGIAFSSQTLFPGDRMPALFAAKVLPLPGKCDSTTALWSVVVRAWLWEMTQRLAVHRAMPFAGLCAHGSWFP